MNTYIERNSYEKFLQKKIKEIGGYRECALMASPHTIYSYSDEWTAEHKVLRVSAYGNTSSSYGWSGSFEYDLVTNKIVG